MSGLAVAKHLHLSSTSIHSAGRRYLCTVLGAMRQSVAQTMSLCWDAARVGHPRKEHVLFAFSCASGTNGVLPPQVRTRRVSENMKRSKSTALEMRSS
eukprot:1484101-Amphidinium_carterae.1